METILRYFTSLTDRQTEQLTALKALYEDWNSKINVISRKDIDNLYLHHVLHSMAIAKVIQFHSGTRIADIGTGGGFPGIPLAILFPECQFTLIDSIGKKIKVAQAVADSIGLKNVKCVHERAEEEKDRFDFIVSRGVMPLPDLARIAARLIDHKAEQHNSYPCGMICLKGGDLSGEIAGFKKSSDITPISGFFKEEFFQDKKIVYVQI